MLNGDTAATGADASFLTIGDGIIKQAKTSTDTHKYKLTGTDYKGTIFPGMLSLMPNKFKNDRQNMRIYCWLDGRGGKNLVLPVFLREVYRVKIGLDEIDDYVLYNRMEDRAYPKIFRCAGWPSGNLNIEVSGLWGYVEEDGSTPPAIKRAAMKLALYYFPALSDSEAQEENAIRGLLLSETTDGHSYSLSNSALSQTITGDSEIDGILKSYMRSRLRMVIV